MCEIQPGTPETEEYLAIEERIINKFPEMRKEVLEGEYGLPCDLGSVFGLQPTLDPVGDLCLEKVLKIIDESKTKREMLRRLREAMKDTVPNEINW